MGFVRRLMSAWRLFRHPQRPYLETAAAALEWPVPAPLARDHVVIDTEINRVVYVLAAECPCGCGERRFAMIDLEPGMPQAAIFVALDVAAVKVLEIVRAAEMAGKAGAFNVEGMGRG